MLQQSLFTTSVVSNPVAMRAQVGVSSASKFQPKSAAMPTGRIATNAAMRQSVAMSAANKNGPAGMKINVPSQMQNIGQNVQRSFKQFGDVLVLDFQNLMNPQ